MNKLISRDNKVFEISCLRLVSFSEAVNLIPYSERKLGTRVIYSGVNGIIEDIVFTPMKHDLINDKDWLDFLNWSVFN